MPWWGILLIALGSNFLGMLAGFLLASILAVSHDENR